MASNPSRIEHDFLGDREVPADAYYGVQTLRGAENFPITGLPLHPALIRAMAIVKKAAALGQPGHRATSTRRSPTPSRGAPTTSSPAS